jgi:hypothetical protein
MVRQLSLVAHSEGAGVDADKLHTDGVGVNFACWYLGRPCDLQWVKPHEQAN